MGLSGCTQEAQETSQIQSNAEVPLIEATLMDYIDGTSVENPEQIQRAFHPDFNLYAVRDDGSLRVWNGQEYISNFKLGDTNSRVGKILAVDVENNIATAKVEILIPESRRYIDLFLLVKYDNKWRIVHKSYTQVPLKAN